MALFDQNKSSSVAEIIRMRQQGLTDNLITNELYKKGYSPEQVNLALSQADDPENTESSFTGIYPESFPAQQPTSPRRTDTFEPTTDNTGNIYERIEEITENIIDEKWDDLIAEVKKIIEWKEKIEEKQIQIANDLTKLKEDFKTLHQGVLGKLEDYDARMQDVGTELKAVGKVFKDVIPEFVENVKELSAVTEKVKGKSNAK